MAQEFESGLPELALFGVESTPACQIFSSVAVSLASYSWISLPKISTSSVWQSTPSRPLRMLLIRFWKCSGELDIPKGTLSQQYLPNGVMKVVSNFESLLSGICQNPLLASSLVKNRALVIWVRVSSTQWALGELYGGFSG